ncbi:ATP-binding protein [Kitasatospora sp. NPDC094019]|uniref:ATP-binding protein n=1 Tax=Kitasatospora sp. NPDC094019 TaxID=3364091 RepID=UPI0038049B76
MPYLAESVAVARGMVREKLAEWGLPELADAAALVVSELTTNAVKTGCRRRMLVTVRQVTAVRIRIAVRDGSRTMPILIEAGDDDEGHRGLALVHLLTRGQWGASLESLGKVVHADLVLRAPNRG